MQNNRGSRGPQVVAGEAQGYKNYETGLFRCGGLMRDMHDPRHLRSQLSRNQAILDGDSARLASRVVVNRSDVAGVQAHPPSVGSGTVL